MPVHKSLKIFTDFKGLDTLSSDYTRGAQYTSNINNARYNKQGSILKRPGHTQIFSSEKYGWGLHKFLNIDLDSGSISEELISLSPYGVYSSTVTTLALGERYFLLEKDSNADFQCRLSGFENSKDGTQDNLFWKGQLSHLAGFHVKLVFSPLNLGQQDVSDTVGTIQGACWHFSEIYDPVAGAWRAYPSADYKVLANKLVATFDNWSDHTVDTFIGNSGHVRGVVLDNTNNSTDYYIDENLFMMQGSGEVDDDYEYSPVNDTISAVVTAGHEAKADVTDPAAWIADPSASVDLAYVYLTKLPADIAVQEEIEVWFGSALPPKPTQVTSSLIFGEQGSTYIFRWALDADTIPPYFQILTTSPSNSSARHSGRDNHLANDDGTIYLRLFGGRWKIDEAYLNNLPHTFCFVAHANQSWGQSSTSAYTLYIDGTEITGADYVSQYAQYDDNRYDHYGLFLGSSLEKFDSTIADTTNTSMDVLIQGWYSGSFNGLMGGRIFDFAIYDKALTSAEVTAVKTQIQGAGLASGVTTNNINKRLLCHYQCGRGSASAGVNDIINSIKGSPEVGLDLDLNVIYDMSGQSAFDPRYAYVQNDSSNAYSLPSEASIAKINSKSLLNSTGELADVIAEPDLSYVSKIHNNIGNFEFENPSIVSLNDVIYIAGASDKNLLKYDGHSIYEAGISSTWDVPLIHKDYEEPFIDSTPSVRVSTNNYMFQGYDEVTDSWDTQAAYRYKFRKVHIDAKGHLNKGTTSSPHLEDQDAGIYRVDAPRGGTYEYIRSTILLGTGEERGSIIIGGDNSAKEVWTAHHPDSKIEYETTGIENTAPIDEDEINRTIADDPNPLLNNIHCEALIGDRVYCMNRNVKNTGACKEGVPGHITEALCTSTAGKAEHGGTWFKTYGAWEYDYQEFIVTAKNGPLSMSALSESTWDGEDMKYYKLTLEPAVEGEPDFKYNDESADWEFTTTEFAQSNLSADRWISTSNHRIQIYRTKNIWYDDGGECKNYAGTSLGYTTRGSCELDANGFCSAGTAGHTTRVLCENDHSSHWVINTWTDGRDKYEPKAEYYLVDEIPYPANTYKSLSFEDDVGSDEIAIDHVSATESERGFLYIDEYHDKALEYRALYIQDDKTPQTPPDCKYATAYGIQLVLSGNAEKPNAVYYSDFDAPENFPERNSFLVDAAVTGIGAINRDLYIFQEDTVQILNGDLIKDNFRVTTLAKGHKIGAVSHNSIVEVRGSMFFLTNKGIFSATPGQPNIKEVSSLIFPEFNPIDYNFKRANAFNWTSENLYLIYLPFNLEGSSIAEHENGRILAFDYERGAWLSWSGIYAGGGIIEYDDNIYFSGVTQKNVTDISTYVGSLSVFKLNQLWDETLLAGNPNVKISIPFEYGTHWESLGDPTSFKKFLRIKIFADDASNRVVDQNLSIDIYKNFKLDTASPWGKVTSLSIPDILTFKTTKLPTGKVNSVNLTFKEDTIGGMVNIKGYELEAVANHQVGEIRE